jgi:hypothetical protein
MLAKCPGAVLVKAECYKKYADYCAAGDFEVEAQRSLTDAMLRSGAISRQLSVKEKDGQHCYQGYRVKHQEPVFPDNIEPKENTVLQDFTSEGRSEK